MEQSESYNMDFMEVHDMKADLPADLPDEGHSAYDTDRRIKRNRASHKRAKVVRKAYMLDENKKLLLQIGIGPAVADIMLKQDNVFTFDVETYYVQRHKYNISGLPKKDAPTSEQAREAGIHMFQHGIIIGFRFCTDRPGEKEVVLAIRFNRWQDLDEDTRHNVRQLGRYFSQMVKALPQVVSNGPWKSSGQNGEMFAVGWRSAYKTDEAMGLYAKAKNAPDSLHQHVYVESHYVAQFYAQRFWSLSPVCAAACEAYLQEEGHPAFGAYDIKNALNNGGIASNLTLTYNNFANSLHQDKDKSPFTFGIWMTTDNDGNIITDQETIQQGIKGGEFIWPQFGCGADFGHCTGFVELIWRGQFDTHGTTKSTTELGLRRWGSSIQVAKSIERGSNRLSKDPSLAVADLPNRYPGWTLHDYLQKDDMVWKDGPLDWRGLEGLEESETGDTNATM